MYMLLLAYTVTVSKLLPFFSSPDTFSHVFVIHLESKSESGHISDLWSNINLGQK